MQNKHLILLVVLCIGFVTTSVAQHTRYAIKNGIGIQGGLTQFDIMTDNFDTVKGDGWLAGLSATVDLPHKWYTVSYSIQMSENTIGILARPASVSPLLEEVDYKIFTAQVAFLFHAKVIQDYVTIDFGPMIQYNSELELKDEDQESYFLNNYNNLLASDITEISPFNVNGAVGATLGFKGFKLRAQYIYGFTNILNKLNNQDLDVDTNTEKFKGNQAMLAFTAMIVF
ncbi:hypothetical protein A9Q86_03790 [Flavobacteriales bacterium 33_180_T64]|nr:hypothetical protein A9Q86_03790 [Flavobacteriales bacterium 33_180_T64]